MIFILHWGITSPYTTANKNFFQKIVDLWWSNILIFPFAQSNHDYDLQFEVDQKKFIDHNLDISIQCTQASNDMAVLIEQIKEHNILYFCGWETPQHLKILRNIAHLDIMLEDKVISWNSAGANIWAKYYYSYSTDMIQSGLWLLPINIMVNYWSDKYKAYNEENLTQLRNHDVSIPTYALKEQEYLIFKVSKNSTTVELI